MKYCTACQRNVSPIKPFNWIVFIFLCGIFYLPVWLLSKPHCPICHGSRFSEEQTAV